MTRSDVKILFFEQETYQISPEKSCRPFLAGGLRQTCRGRGGGILRTTTVPGEEVPVEEGVILRKVR